MGPRFVFSALVVAFVVAITFAAITTVRHVNAHSSSLMHRTSSG
jgi:hypothetical protein